MRRRYRGTLALAMLLFAGCERGCGCESEKKPAPAPARTSSESSSGCGSSSSGAGCGAVDLSGDGGCLFCAEDTRVPFDSGRSSPPDTSTPSCLNPYVESHTCQVPIVRVGQKVCTDEKIRALSACFRGEAKDCYAARDAYGDCASCMLEDLGDAGAPIGWIDGNRIDYGACIQAIDSKSTCGTTVNCTRECMEVACIDCREGDELDECLGSVVAPASLEPSADAGDAGDADADASVDDADADAFVDDADAGGVCYRIAAKDWEACARDPRFRPCMVRSFDDLLPFFRGACRDGADWSRAYEPDGTGDAGADADADTDASDG